MVINVRSFLFALMVMSIVASIMSLIFIVSGLDKVNRYMVGAICCLGVVVATSILGLIMFILYYCM